MMTFDIKLSEESVVKEDNFIGSTLGFFTLGAVSSLIYWYAFADTPIAKDTAEYVIESQVKDINQNGRDKFLSTLFSNKERNERNCVAETKNEVVTGKYEHFVKQYNSACSVFNMDKNVRPKTDFVQYDYFIPASSQMFILKDGKYYAVSDSDKKNKLLYNVAPSNKFWADYELFWRKGSDCVTTKYIEHPKFELKDKSNKLILTELSADIAFMCKVDDQYQTKEISNVKLFNYKG